MSYDDYVILDEYGKYYGRTSLTGTAIRIRIPIHNIGNANNVISTISARGEIQSKTIRHAFTKASLPSKGLMDDIGIFEDAK